MLRILLCIMLLPGTAQAQDAGALRARYTALEAKLASNGFGRPLHVESAASGNTHKGEIYAVIERPFGDVAPALARPEHWCQILTLQVNVKRCESSNGQTLATFVTRKPRDPLDSAHRVEFRYEPVIQKSDYLRAALSAPSGPVGTRNYTILLEVAPLDSRRTFVHMSYAYTLGTMARVAMDAYLAGSGREKRGFTVEGGERAVVERNAMRHYLAIEAYLESLAMPPAQRLEARLRRWYSETTRYPQLQERVSADEYLEMKRREAG